MAMTMPCANWSHMVHHSREGEGEERERGRERGRS